MKTAADERWPEARGLTRIVRVSRSADCFNQTFNLIRENPRPPRDVVPRAGISCAGGSDSAKLPACPHPVRTRRAATGLPSGDGRAFWEGDVALFLWRHLFLSEQ
jgi:hypothetical protein